jgi:hypothetical protein
MTTDQFVGVWKLVSCELRTEGGETSYPYGRNPKGYIMYSSEGYMSVAFMGDDRPRFGSDDIWAGTAEEKLAAFATYTSYCGKFTVAENKVVHHIEVSLYPNWVGVNQERFFEFDGDKLCLSTSPFLIAGAQQTAHLIWERV